MARTHKHEAARPAFYKLGDTYPRPEEVKLRTVKTFDFNQAVADKRWSREVKAIKGFYFKHMSVTDGVVIRRKFQVALMLLYDFPDYFEVVDETK